MASTEGRPVMAGLAALLGVGLAVGLVLGAGALGATKVLGLGGDGGGGSARVTAGETLYLPDPQPTDPNTDPAFTIDASPQVPLDAETEPPPEEETPVAELTLQAARNAVSPMERIDLTGVYGDGEGAILMVQRFENEEWRDFGVTMSVRGGIFSTYIQTGRVGEHRFRVKDTDSERASNEVTVTVG